MQFPSNRFFFIYEYWNFYFMYAKKSVHGPFKANALKAIWLLLIFSQRKLQMKLLCFLIYLWKGRPSTVPSVATNQRRKITQNCKFLLLWKKKVKTFFKDVIQSFDSVERRLENWPTVWNLLQHTMKEIFKMNFPSLKKTPPFDNWFLRKKIICLWVCYYHHARSFNFADCVS